MNVEASPNEAPAKAPARRPGGFPPPGMPDRECGAVNPRIGSRAAQRSRR